MAELVVAITGASGAVYARRLLEVLGAGADRVHLSISPAGAQVLLEAALALDANLGGR